MRLVIDCFKLIKGTGKSIGIYNVALGIVKHLGEMNSNAGFGKAEILIISIPLIKKIFEVSQEIMS